MKRFIKRTILFFLPLAAIFATYIIFDPFRVLYPYTDYYKNTAVTLNRDYISTEIFLKNRVLHKYNAFIFGSSRTGAFRTDEWKKYLPRTAKPFVFAASCENLDGIHAKIKLIDELKDDFQNVLLILDTDYSFSALPAGHLFVKHPRLTESSRLSFHLVYVKAYFTNFFFLRFLDYKINRQYRPYMGHLLINYPIEIDTVTNDFYLIEQESEQKNNPSEYYRKKRQFFYPRTTSDKIVAGNLIDREAIHILKDIHRIFKKHQTKYKIVISPLYDQKALNKNDLSVLNEIFGDKNVFDYSGTNQYTETVHNYYEHIHYTTEVGNDILKTIYTD